MQRTPRDESGSTVALTTLVPFMRLLHERGPELQARSRAHSEPLFARWGIDPASVGQDRTMRLPLELVIDLFVGFVDVLGDPAAPLRAGQRVRPGDYELLDYLCATCGTLGEAIACLGWYYPLVIDAEFGLVMDGERAELRFQIRPGLRAVEAMHEFALASTYTLSGHHLRPQHVAPLLEVCFAHRAPAHAAIFGEVFRAPVRFECGRNALVFPRSRLTRRMAAADPVLHATLKRLADQELAALDARNAFPSRVRAAIEAELESGVTMTRVCARLRTSTSTLRGRLRQHGTSFSRLVDAVRKEHAGRALRQSGQNVSEIAYSLGFKNPPAFNRAFRRWFGVTPLAYREALHNPAANFFKSKRG